MTQLEKAQYTGKAHTKRGRYGTFGLVSRAASRSWAEKAYPKLIHYNRLDKGGHFAAWEQPKVFSEEIRASFRSLR